LSVFAGAAIVVFRIQLPEVIQKTINLFSGSVTAVVLFSLGLFLGLHNAGRKQEWLKAGVWIIITMIVIPLVYSFVIRRTDLPVSQIRASILDAAMPLGLTPYALSVQYQLETPLVARIVVLGTLFSVVLIPLWISWIG
jgi:predicted permease